jgi:hypothetical protein
MILSSKIDNIKTTSKKKINTSENNERERE